MGTLGHSFLNRHCASNEPSDIPDARSLTHQMGRLMSSTVPIMVLVLLGFPAVAAQLDLLDNLLSDKAAAPCELKPCVPVCKTVLEKTTVGRTPRPMSSTECAPDRACVEANIKCLSTIRAHETKANGDLMAGLKGYSDTSPSSPSAPNPSSDSRLNISRKWWGHRH